MKYIFFFLYSLLIYNLLILAVALFLTIENGFMASYRIIWQAMSLHYAPGLLLQKYNFPITKDTIEFMVYAAANGISIVLWLKKQTIPSAWLLSLTGAMAGPGIVLLQNGNHSLKICSGYILFASNLFYLLLLMVNYVQKQIWPQSRMSASLRDILKNPFCNQTSINGEQKNPSSQVDGRMPQAKHPPAPLAEPSLDHSAMSCAEYTHNREVETKIIKYFFFLIYTWAIYTSYAYTAYST